MSALPATLGLATVEPRARGRGWPVTVAGLLAIALLLGLGCWQVERRAWKLALIDRIEQRIHAPAVPAPGRAEWARVNRRDHEYRRVQVAGRFLRDRDTLVQAVTELGGGWWVMTPLVGPDGTVVLVNRGFVAAGAGTPPAAPPDAEVAVTGLLRVSEPGGAFLRRNDPATGRWTSRDVDAIGRARGLRDVAPYFIDAEADVAPPAGPGVPRGGLTRVTFPNHHAVYALTWFALAAMVAGGLVYRRRLDVDTGG